MNCTDFSAIVDESGAAHGAVGDLPRGVHIRLADALEAGAERGLRVSGRVRVRVGERVSVNG